MTKTNTSSYPIELVKNYRNKNITRSQYIGCLRQWQKDNGMDFACKGTADKSGTYLTYRGIKAEIKNNGLICWKNIRAAEVEVFKRLVDFAFEQEFRSFKFACHAATKACDAVKRGDFDEYARMQEKQLYFLTQAEKWGALWS